MTTQNTKDNDKDLEFIYDDCDSYENEISELYTYTEEIEFESNLENFEILLKTKDYQTWNDLNYDTKKSLIMHIIQVIELADKAERLKAVRWLLYLVQGVYGECLTKDQQTRFCRENCVLLYRMGVFAVVKDLLMMEISTSENNNASESQKMTLFSIADCVDLRSILTILYIMVETLRRNDELDSEEMKQARKEFLADLGQSLSDNESLVITLFDMVVKFCSEASSCLPMKKVLLLLWKLLLAILGGFKSVHDAKENKRKEAGLKVLDENALEIVQSMKASAPPASPSDILEIAQGSRRRRGRNTFYEIEGNGLDSEVDENRSDKSDSAPFEEEKVTSIDDDLMETNPDPVDKIILENEGEAVVDQSSDILVIGEEKLEKDEDPPSAPAPGAMTPMPSGNGPSASGDTASIAAKLIKLRKQQQEAEETSSLPVVKVVSGLPWIPKAREKDVEVFLNLVRQKFIGFPLPGDLTTEAGLPNPTKDSISVLRKHLYTPLGDVEVAQEAEIAKFPLTIGKSEIVPDTLTERLYQAMLPNLPQYMIALLKILLAAAPTSKAKNDSINVLSDVLPEAKPTGHVASLKVGIDVNRHREIIVKSISAIILLLLKHFKLSHIYQFEYASQHLVFANCIPLVLKFFNHNIVAYVTTKNAIPCLEFPGCVLGDRTELTAESLEGLDTSTAPCWRNLFSCINLLRILNKLVKWKHSRTMMLVVFKSAPILKRALKVRQAMFQLYVLKLLKIQTKYLGRQWRKSNMKIMSAIYQKVRHRLNDDWAFGNDVDARPWDFQQEESSLRTFVERFNLRRYHVTGSRSRGTPNVSSPIEEDYEPVDNNIQNLLREEIELPSDFQKSYDVWLEREVFSSSIDWDQLLAIPCVQ